MISSYEIPRKGLKDQYLDVFGISQKELYVIYVDPSYLILPQVGLPKWEQRALQDFQIFCCVNICLTSPVDAQKTFGNPRWRSRNLLKSDPSHLFFRSQIFSSEFRCISARPFLGPLPGIFSGGNMKKYFPIFQQVRGWFLQIHLVELIDLDHFHSFFGVGFQISSPHNNLWNWWMKVSLWCKSKLEAVGLQNLQNPKSTQIAQVSHGLKHCLPSGYVKIAMENHHL